MKQKCEYCHKKTKHTKLIEHDRVFYYVCKNCYKDIKRHHAREELNEQLKRTAIMLVATRHDMILGKKHYPRTLKNIETRQRQLSGVYTALQRADKSKEAQKMMRILNRAIVRYELALIRIYRQIALSHKNYLIGQGRWDELRELENFTAKQATGSILQDLRWKPKD